MKIKLLFLFIISFVSCKKNVKVEELTLPQVSSIKFENPETSIILGKTLQLNLSYEPNNAIKPIYEWHSSNPNILSVTDKGVVHAKSIGGAIINVGIKNTNIFINHYLEVVPDLITSITLDKTEIKLSVHQQEKINFSVLPLTAASAPIKWISSNPSVAQVTSTGVVTGMSSGNAVVSATSLNGMVTAKANVEVIPEVRYSADVFKNLKNNLLDPLILYNEQQGKILAEELKAGKVEYIVLAESAIEETHLTSNPGYPEAMFSNLRIPSGDVLKIKSNFSFSLFPNTSRMGLLNLEINFFEKSWEIKGTRAKVYTYSYSYNVTLAELKAIIDENISDIRRYVTIGSY